MKQCAENARWKTLKWKISGYRALVSCHDRQLHRLLELEEWDSRGIIRAIIIETPERMHSCNNIILADHSYVNI